MAKKVSATVRFEIPAGNANPAPPIGSTLGQVGVNIMEFCKQFNTATIGRYGEMIPVVVTVYEDKSFTMVIKSPTAKSLLKKFANIATGGHKPGQETAGTVTWEQCLEIGRIKEDVLNARTPEARARMIAGTARSMGIDVVGIPA